MVEKNSTGLIDPQPQTDQPGKVPDAKGILQGSINPSLWQGKFVFHPLRTWATESPERMAVLCEYGNYTYGELEAKTNQIAHFLRSRGLRRGDLVSLLFPRGSDILVAILGVMKAGGAYVPIDPESPQERVLHCLEDANPAMVVAHTGVKTEYLPHHIDTVSWEFMVEKAAEFPSKPYSEAEVDLRQADPAYVIFTSGTTGRPKGVPITHAGLSNFVWGDQVECIRVESNDRVFQGFSPASDGYHEEVWPTLLAGATLVIATTNDIHSGQGLGDFLDHHQVNIISCAPTLLSMVDRDIPSIKRVLFGAERLPPELLRRWWKPNREIINTYGPTEATVGATFSLCRPDEPVAIGRPLPNYTCYVLDTNLAPVEQGEEGELCVAGVGVSPGYLASAKNSPDRFLPNPFAKPELNNPLLYRTGDRVRINPEGNLEWLGRIDSQVKIRGHRIELSDIETQMTRHPAVQTAIAVTREDTEGGLRLVGLLVLNPEVPFVIADYLTHLFESLPTYMVPHSLEQVERIPRLPSGKADRRGCQILRGVTLRIEREILPPTTATESLILSVWQRLFPDAEISCNDDFFRDLGGFSLLASRFVSILRTEHGILDVSVLDIYENSTLKGFSSVLDSRLKGGETQPTFEPIPETRFRMACFWQGIGVMTLFALQAFLWLGPLIATIYMSDKGLDNVRSVLFGLFIHAITIPLMFAIAIASKWLVGGKVKPGSYPLWGGTFLRWWFVKQIFSVTPAAYLTGTPFAAMYLRLLGAKIGKNCMFESLEFDSPDLIEVGDDCVFENSSWLHPAEVAGGYLHLRPIKVGNGCSMGVRSGITGGGSMADGSSLRDLTCVIAGMQVPPGQEWHGSPARLAPERTMPSYDPTKRPTLKKRISFGVAQAVLLVLLFVLELVPFLTTAWVLYDHGDPLGAYWIEPVFAVGLVLFATLQVLLVKWLVLGKLKPGVYPAPGFTWLRTWFTDKHLELISGILVPIYDSLFARPLCIGLGMKCGPRCEIALPRRMPYDLVEMGEESFLASEVSIGRPIQRNGQIFLEKTVVGRRAFLGNDSVVPQGSYVPDESLLGVLSVCPSPKEMGDATDQAWLGSPAFHLPRRQTETQFDIKQTYRPTKRLYIKRLLHEALRIVLPSMFSLFVAIGIIESFVAVWNERSLLFAFAVSPFLYLGGSIAGFVMILISKAILVGRYRPTIKPLWSRFVWNTETYSAIIHDFGVPLFIRSLEGTALMSLMMRALGAHIGRRAFINTTDYTETDMLYLGEDVAINAHAPLQAHLFEDRVIKVGRISVGDRSSVGNYTVVLCDSEVKNDVYVGPLSLVMKGETIPAHTSWAGSPARVSITPAFNTSYAKALEKP